MEFKQGDRVEIVAVNSELSDDNDKDLFIGEKGTIVLDDGSNYYPCKIKFDKDSLQATGEDLWDRSELKLIEELKPNQFLYYNDTKRTVVIHPATKSHGTDCNMNDILAGEMRMFYLPEGTYAWTKMWDYGGERGLQLLVSPTPFTVEEMKAKKNTERVDEIIKMLKSEDGNIIDVFEALHNLKKWVN